MSPKSSDAYQEHALPDDFPISTLGEYRNKMVVPDGPFDAAGNWRQTFGFHSVASGSSRVGTVTIERHVGSDGVAIDVRREKILTGGPGVGGIGGKQPRSVEEAQMRIGDDAELSAPVAWSFRTRVLDAAGEPIADLGIERRCSVREGRLTMTTNDTRLQTVPLTGRYTVNWALFDAVGRLPREPFEPVHFTLLHHFDQLKPQQELRFRRMIDTEVAGKKCRLYGFDQTGRGVMPWTYWVDEAGRLLAVISGLEVYILEST